VIYFDETSPYEPNQRLAIRQLLCREISELQEIVIFDNPAYGRVLALDGLVQTTELDEFIYHEMAVHTPILAHGAVKRVLIVGGGDGGALRTTLAHPIEHVTLVELDRRVIELSRRYLPAICGDAFDDPRAETVIADGATYLAHDKSVFDLIIVDSTDPVGPAEMLFGESFYQLCRQRLRSGGILITQSGIPFLQKRELRRSSDHLRAVFADVAFYCASIPSYGGALAFGWASNEPAHRQVGIDTLRRRYRETQLSCRYYSPELHHAAFVLPPYVREIVGA
jgi:spermidine synthase